METPKKPEPDGMVHYHPKYGWYWPKLTADSYANLKSYGYKIKPVWLSTEPPVPKEVYSEFDVRKHVLHPESYIALESGEIKVKHLNELLEWVEKVRSTFQDAADSKNAKEKLTGEDFYFDIDQQIRLLTELESILPGEKC